MAFAKRNHGIYEVNVIEALCNMFLLSNKMEITERPNLMALRAEVSRNNIFFSVKMRKFSDYFRIFPKISASFRLFPHLLFILSTKGCLKCNSINKKQKGFVKA